MQHQQGAEERGLLGLLCPGHKKLEGKTFYLDSLKKRATALLLEAISLHGGRVESFLHKDVSFVVTGSQEGLNEQKCPGTKEEPKESDEVKRPIMTRESPLSKPRPGTPRPTACGSRGKALLEKAIRNNERLKGSSVLANARSWGVKIVHVDDVLLYLKLLTRESVSAGAKRAERTQSKQSAHVVKAAALRSPYLKIEDLSRKYRPLHMQSMSFPTLCFSGRFSPFESPPPPFDTQAVKAEDKTREKKKEENSRKDKSETVLSCNPSPWRLRKKNFSFCECCQQPFTSLDEHLQSDQHRAFVTDLSNYVLVDRLLPDFLPGFDPNPAEHPEESLSRSLSLMEDLQPLTDLETEHAVQALQSFSTHTFSPAKNPLPSGPPSPSPPVQPLSPSLDPSPADVTPFTLSPAMPVLDPEPRSRSLSSQEDREPLGTLRDAECQSPGPYSLPPVLSPQVPETYFLMEPRSLYSDPPILSPQKSITDIAEGHTFEMEMAGRLSQCIQAAPTLSNTESDNGLNHERLSGSSEVTCLIDASESASRRSHPLETAPNPRKRHRSNSSKHSRSKKRRLSKQGHISAEEGTVMATNHWEGLLFHTQISDSSPKPEISSRCTGETLSLKHTFPMFCVPAVQNFTQSLNLKEVLAPGCTSLLSSPSWPPFSEEKKLAPLVLAGENHLSSQDPQHSTSLSTSICIEPALIPDLAALSASSSDSDWDCELLSRLRPSSAAPLSPSEPSCDLDQELLHRPCTWMHNSSYESRLHTVLQPPASGTSLCGEETEASAFSRTVMQVVEVQH